MRAPLDDRTEQLLRELAPQVLGAVTRRYRDFAAAEDAVQEALVAASQQWPTGGVPENPRGWLIQVASRRVVDQVRSDVARRRREADVAGAIDWNVSPPDIETERVGDDTLVLLFTCCHPSLTASSAVALTLRAVGGLTTAEIARAFFVPEATMAQRISRAKQTIKSSGVRFELPAGPKERSDRLAAVLHVLYLTFNEGYTSSAGDSLQRDDLSREAIRLTRALHAVANETEVAGLLALMLLTDARRSARTGPNGELIPLTDQDRRLWDRAAIDEGVALITATLPRGAVGPYQLQAAIAAIHDEAGSVHETDWPQILGLYGLLLQMTDNPMVRLNHAVATAMVQGPAAGLALLEPLDADPRLAYHHRLHAVRGHLLEMTGNTDAAIARYRAAADRAPNLPERNYLLTQAARLATSRTP